MHTESLLTSDRIIGIIGRVEIPLQVGYQFLKLLRYDGTDAKWIEIKISRQNTRKYRK